MTKPSCAVAALVSSLLLATLAAADASSSSPPSSLGRHPELVLGHKGRELGQGQSSGNHYQHQGNHMQQPEEVEVAMEVKKPVEEEKAKTTARWTAERGEDAEAGLIYSVDYRGVAMHVGSLPTAKPRHRHPKP